MANTFTKYEMALTDGEKVILSLGFTAKRTKRSLLNALMASGPEVIAAAKWGVVRFYYTAFPFRCLGRAGSERNLQCVNR